MLVAVVAACIRGTRGSLVWNRHDVLPQGTKVEGVINKLFEGRILKFIKCLNVDYKSTKRDDYMDIFLDVKGCKNVYESFDRLTAEERLDGDNQYNAEGHGLQVCRIIYGAHGTV
jgi:ubiquitin C-terminal hydrolase